MDNLMQQPSLKKMATVGPMGVMPVNSMPVNMKGPAGGFSTVLGGPGVGVSSISRQLPTEKMLRREVSNRAIKTSTVLAQAWKDTDGGHLLASLFELFGESMFCFTSKSELSFFL